MASDFSIRHAAYVVRNGGIIAYPTDTIYGLGCDPYNEDALTRLNRIKQRPSKKQFILLASQIEQIHDLVTLTDRQQERISQTDEPTSWVIDASQSAPAWLLSDEGTITIRISQCSIIEKLCHSLGHAIISTSANLSGQRPAHNALELHQRFHNSVDKIMASNTSLIARPSKIIHLNDNHTLRN